MSDKKQARQENFSLGGQIKIRPIFGNQRTIVVSRTRIRIELVANAVVSISATRIILPCLEEDESVYELDLTEDGFKFQKLQGQAFSSKGLIISSMNIFGGECLYLSNNQLNFIKATKITEIENNHSTQVYAKSNLPILIYGESGTGKSTFAQQIHKECGGAGRFIQVNLSAISDGLFESELFGHKKGSFTGAVSDKIGFVEACSNGTLFIDEIDSLSLSKQVKLLQLLEEKIYYPVGASISQKVKCRFIFASGRDLMQAVKSGKIREDLYYRLASGFIHWLKPLKGNLSEIDRQLNKFSNENGVYISSKLRHFYLEYSWPGNFRQLHCHLTRKLHAGGSFIECDEFDHHLLSNVIEKKGDDDFEVEELENFKRDYIQMVFRRLGSDKNVVASKLKISPNTLRKYLAMPQ